MALLWGEPAFPRGEKPLPLRRLSLGLDSVQENFDDVSGVRGAASMPFAEAEAEGMGEPSQDSTEEVLKGTEEAKAEAFGFVISCCYDGVREGRASAKC